MWNGILPLPECCIIFNEFQCYFYDLPIVCCNFCALRDWRDEIVSNEARSENNMLDMPSSKQQQQQQPVVILWRIPTKIMICTQTHYAQSKFKLGAVAAVVCSSIHRMHIFHRISFRHLSFVLCAVFSLLCLDFHFGIFRSCMYRLFMLQMKSSSFFTWK